MKKKKKYVGDESPYFEFPKKQGRGSWCRVSRPISAALGWRDELVLRTIHDFYNIHRTNLKSDYSCWLSAPDFKKITGLSRYYQEQSYDNFRILNLITDSEEYNGADNTTCRILNLCATWILFWLIYHHDKVLRKRYKDRHKKLSYADKCKKLRVFYEKLLKKKPAKRFRNFVREITKLVDDVDELENGEWDLKMEDFYDKLCKTNK